MATVDCPECGKPVSETAPSCKHCGAEFGDAAPPPPRRQEMGDSAKYMIIIGSIVAIVAVVLLVASGMGGTKHCGDCKGKGTLICTNCREGTPKCGGCKGSGKDPQTFSTCATCNGSGAASVCPKCKGEPKRKCPSCGGSGQIKQ